MPRSSFSCRPLYAMPGGRLCSRGARLLMRNTAKNADDSMIGREIRQHTTIVRFLRCHRSCRARETYHNDGATPKVPVGA